MKNFKGADPYILLWLIFSFVIFDFDAHSQVQVKGCQKKMPGSSDVISCFSRQPCILWLRQNGMRLELGWDGQKNYDTYTLRWSQIGQKGHQIKLPGGEGGVYELKNLNPCQTYSLRVQGCKVLTPKGALCSHWGTALFSLKSDLQPK